MRHPLKVFVAASLVGMAATAAICNSLPGPSAAPSISSIQSCLPYNRQVTLSGRIEYVRAHFDGNMNVPSYYELHLDRPICTVEDDDDEAEAGQTLLHMWNYHPKSAPAGEVQVTGKLWHAQSLHARTQIVIDEAVVR